MTAEVQQASLWAFRSLENKDPALRHDLIAEPTEEYLVPASAGLVALVCRKLGVEPTEGNEGEEIWRSLRGRPTVRLYQCYTTAAEAARNDDPREVKRLLIGLGRKYPDELDSDRSQRTESDRRHRE